MYDEVLTVANEDAIAAMRALAREEGLLVGISSGRRSPPQPSWQSGPEFAGKRIVALLPDTGERYLSTKWLLLPEIVIKKTSRRKSFCAINCFQRMLYRQGTPYRHRIFPPIRAVRAHTEHGDTAIDDFAAPGRRVQGDHAAAALVDFAQFADLPGYIGGVEDPPYLADELGIGIVGCRTCRAGGIFIRTMPCPVR